MSLPFFLVSDFAFFFSVEVEASLASAFFSRSASSLPDDFPSLGEE